MNVKNIYIFNTQLSVCIGKFKNISKTFAISQIPKILLVSIFY